jgi:adhesin/invasin
MTKFRGDNQTAPVGSAVPGAVAAFVGDVNFNPIEGVPVTWGNVTGGGSITGETQTTNAQGVATLGSWTLGPTAGVNTTTATSPGFSSITFSANGAAPARMAIAAGNNQIATAGTAVPGVVCVIVSDLNNNAIAGVEVTWGSVTGGGSVTGATQMTGANGIATMGSWTLGLAAGTNTILRRRRA